VYKDFPKKDRHPKISLFTVIQPLQFTVQNTADLREYLEHYIMPGLIQLLVDQTNLYAQHVAATIPRTITKHSHSEQWKPVTITEMKKFLGLMFLVGII
jgi:hypothetical protein